MVDTTGWNDTDISDANLNKVSVLDYADFASFPSAGTMPNGIKVIDRSTGNIYRNNSGTWTKISGGGSEGDMAYPLSTSLLEYAEASSVDSYDTTVIPTDELLEPFNSLGTWTKVGTKATIADGKGKWSGQPNDTSRLHKQIKPSANWVIDFDLKVDSSNSNGSSYDIVDITETDAVPWSGNPQYSILYMWHDNSNTTNGKIRISGRLNGAESGTTVTSTATFSYGTQYYCRAKKTSGTGYTLGIYASEANRDAETSPIEVITFTAAVSKTYDQFNHIQILAGKNVADNGTAVYEIDNLKSEQIFEVATAYVTDDVENPSIKFDFGSARDMAAFALIVDTVATTVSQVKIRINTVNSFSDDNLARTLNVANMLDSEWFYELINRLPEDMRYVELVGVGSGVITASLRARYGLTDWERRHFHRIIDPSN